MEFEKVTKEIRYAHVATFYGCVLFAAPFNLQGGPFPEWMKYEDSRAACADFLCSFFNLGKPEWQKLMADGEDGTIEVVCIRYTTDNAPIEYVIEGKPV